MSLCLARQASYRNSCMHEDDFLPSPVKFRMGKKSVMDHCPIVTIKKTPEYRSIQGFYIFRRYRIKYYIINFLNLIPTTLSDWCQPGRLIPLLLITQQY